MQFHPEFKSKPLRPHPLFAGFVEAAYKRQHVAAGRHDERDGDWRPAQPSLSRLVTGVDVPPIIDPCADAGFAACSRSSDRRRCRPRPARPGPDRRTVRHRKRRSTPSISAARSPPSRDGRRAVRLQGVVRQSQPNVARVLPRAWASRRAWRPSAGSGSEVGVPDPDGHPRTVAGAAGGRGRRHPPDSGVPLAPDRPDRRGRARPARVVNLKKGQFLAPLDMRHAIDKVRASGNDRVFVTERGFSFGYNNLVVDMRAFPMMRSLGAAGRLRRDAQPAAAGRRRRRHGRPGRVHRAARARGRRRRRGRRVPRSARGTGARQERRAERAGPRPAARRCWTSWSRSTRWPKPAKSAAVSAVNGRTAPRRSHRSRTPGPRDRGAGDSRADPPTRARRSPPRVALLHACTGRVIVTGMGKSGIIAQKARRHAVEHRHGRARSSIRPKRCTATSASSSTATS